MNAFGFTHCAGCDVVVVAETGPVENYMVHDDVWTEAGMDYADGFLCLSCIESRLGRRLTGADLSLDMPLNWPGMQRDTARIAKLKSDAWNLASNSRRAAGVTHA